MKTIINFVITMITLAVIAFAAVVAYNTYERINNPKMSDYANAVIYSIQGKSEDEFKRDFIIDATLDSINEVCELFNN